MIIVILILASSFALGGWLDALVLPEPPRGYRRSGGSTTIVNLESYPGFFLLCKTKIRMSFDEFRTGFKIIEDKKLYFRESLFLINKSKFRDLRKKQEDASYDWSTLDSMVLGDAQLQPVLWDVPFPYSEKDYTTNGNERFVSAFVRDIHDEVRLTKEQGSWVIKKINSREWPVYARFSEFPRNVEFVVSNLHEFHRYVILRNYPAKGRKVYAGFSSPLGMSLLENVKQNRFTLPIFVVRRSDLISDTIPDVINQSEFDVYLNKSIIHGSGTDQSLDSSWMIFEANEVEVNPADTARRDFEEGDEFKLRVLCHLVASDKIPVIVTNKIIWMKRNEAFRGHLKENTYSGKVHEYSWRSAESDSAFVELDSVDVNASLINGQWIDEHGALFPDVYQIYSAKMAEKKQRPLRGALWIATSVFGLIVIVVILIRRKMKTVKKSTEVTTRLYK